MAEQVHAPDGEKRRVADVESEEIRSNSIAITSSPLVMLGGYALR
jgi:hypothetical protein